MLKDLERNGALRPLRYPGEYDLTQFGEHRRGKTEQAVSAQKADWYQQISLRMRHRQDIDDMFEYDGYGNIGDFRCSQAGKGEDKSPFPCPQVWPERAECLPVMPFDQIRSGEGGSGR